MNTGEVVVRTVQTGGHTEYSPIGHAINLAQRMESAAPSETIVVSEETRRLVEGYFELRAMGPTEVKGISEPIEVYEVVGVGALHGHFALAARRGLTKLRRSRARACGRCGARSISREASRAARRGDGGGGHRQVAAVPRVQGNHTNHCKVLEAYSVSHGKASAWLPVLELLRGYFRNRRTTDDASSRREKVRGVLSALDAALDDTLPYLFGLLGIVEAPDPLAQMDANIKRQRTLDAIKRILLQKA